MRKTYKVSLVVGDNLHNLDRRVTVGGTFVRNTEQRKRS